MTKIRPLGDRVLLKGISENSEQTSSGIILQESKQKEVPYIYEVIKVWPGTDKNKMTVKVWDKVLSGQYSGDEVKIDWENYKIVSIDYILGVVED